MSNPACKIKSHVIKAFDAHTCKIKSHLMTTHDPQIQYAKLRAIWLLYRLYKSIRLCCKPNNYNKLIWFRVSPYKYCLQVNQCCFQALCTIWYHHFWLTQYVLLQKNQVYVKIVNIIIKTYPSKLSTRYQLGPQRNM